MKIKSTKRALLMSVLSLLLCMSMLVGTTFAWFTDSVTSGKNTIQSGNLDVELYYSDKAAGPWTKVTSSTDIFGYNLWEPGYTKVAYFKVVNEGSLALKYTLTADVYSETPGINKDGKNFLLSDYLYTKVVDAGATRADILASTDGKQLKGAIDIDNAGSLLTKGAEDIVGLAIWMPVTVGNEANHNGTAPQIDFGINLLATQEMKEEDSFGIDYDKNAPLLTWDGSVNTSWYTGNATTYVLSTPADLAGLAQLVNAGNAFTGMTLTLGADMDLNNLAWTPIGTSSDPFNGTLDGKGFTIYNLNVSGDSWVGLVGYVRNNASIYNVTVVGANVVGNDYVGTVLGGGYLAKDCIAGCTVKDATVIATAYYDDAKSVYDGGAKAGVIAGYAINGNIYNNKAIDSTVYAYRDLGGIVGMAQGENRKISVYGNTVDNVSLYYTTVAGVYEGGKTNSNMNSTVGRTSNATVGFNDGNANMPEDVATVTDTTASLKQAVEKAESGDTIVIIEGEYTLPTLANKEGVTIIGTEGTVVGGENTTTGFGSNFGKDTTIKNVTFAGASNGVRWSYANGGESTFDNCTFQGDSTYGFHIDQSNGATFTFNNCTFVGFNAFAGDLKKIIFNNCTFLHNGNYGHTNIWSVAEFNNCTWGDKTSVSGGKLYFNGVEESYHHEFIGSAESLFDFAKSVNEGNDSWSGQKVLLVADIDLENAVWTPIGQTGATQFKGIFDGQGYTIKNLKVDSSAQTGAHYSSGLFGWLNSATVKNVKVDKATVIGNHNVAVIAGYLETSGCTVSGCEVTNATVTANHANDDACGDKVGVIVGHAGNAGVKVENCSASKSTVTAGRDAGQIVGAAKTANVTGCTATEVTVSATGNCNREGNINNAIIGRVL